MKLNTAALRSLDTRILQPVFDPSAIKPGILHIGVGGFHRAHQALYVQELIESGEHAEWGICGVGLLAGDRKMQSVLRSQDFLYTVLEKDTKGEQARVVASITDFIVAPDEPQSLMDRLAAPDTCIVSLTITEGGYYFNSGTGEFDNTHPAIQQDIANPESPTTIYGYLFQALKARRDKGIAPFTILSCDNIQGNGDLTRKMLLAFAERVDADMAQWIAQEVTFPNTMVDRITPVTTDAERDYIAQTYGIEDAWPVVCETFRQWVIEDHFCNGRPAFEKVGVQMTDDVRPYETMKIRLLNASHSAMGYLGYLAGYRFIYEIMADKEFAAYIRALMDQEVTPLLPPVEGIDLAQYKSILIERFANPNIKDQATRICMDGSSKMPKFILPSLREAQKSGGDYRRLAFCVASWFRFLQGTDESGNPIPLDDPQGAILRTAAIAGGKDPRPLLNRIEIFGDLGQDENAVKAIETALISLYERGARVTLRDYL